MNRIEGFFGGNLIHQLKVLLLNLPNLGILMKEIQGFWRVVLSVIHRVSSIPDHSVKLL